MADANDTPAKPGEGLPPHKRWPKLPADHPLFSRGYVIGMKRAANFSTSDEPLCKICGRLVWRQQHLSLCAECRDSPWGDPEEEP